MNSEKVCVSQERVSGFPEKGVALCGSPGNSFRSLGDFRETSGLPLSSTVRELPGKSPGNLRGSSGNLLGSPVTFQKEPDSIPATRHICLQVIQGEKEYTPPPRDPSFLGLSPNPEVTEQKKLWCIPFSWENKGKGVDTIGPERRVYTIEPQTWKKKKRRVSTVVVYTFFFPVIGDFDQLVCEGQEVPQSEKFKVTKK